MTLSVADIDGIRLGDSRSRSDAACMSDAALCLKYCALPFVHKDHAIQARYIRMRINGESHSVAEMLATRSFPGISGTNAVFMKGTHHQDAFVDRMRYQAAKEQGVDTNGRRYVSGLARFPNDPEAWVSSSSDVLRICRDRGWNCDGLVKHEAPPVTPEPDVAIADDIVRQHVDSCLAAYDSGERTERLKDDITERVTQELTGQISLNPEPKVQPYEDPFSLPGMQPD